MAIYFFLSQHEQGTQTEQIVVSYQSLEEYVQFRSKAFNQEHAQRLLNELSDTELQQLLQEYRREEALYQEAQKLGLERGDYVIKQRLVGKMTYLSELRMPNITPQDKDLEEFFATNIADYVELPSVTFTHVFLSAQDQTESSLLENASTLLTDLRASSVEPELANQYGDRFLFRTHYVDQGYIAVSAELGESFARKIFSADTLKQEWIGPLTSKYGAHLVYVISVQSEKNPKLQDVRAQVREDFIRSQQQAFQKAYENTIVADYPLHISPELQDWINDRESQAPNEALIVE